PLGELVRGWEKLRLLYNGILLLPGTGVLILWITRQHLPVPAAIIGGILVGIGANIAFMLGPLAELYLRGLLKNGAPLGKGRLLIFSAGLVVSAGVFVIFGIIPFL
ncbi:MAG: hypothetical protein RLZZ214_3814, partial [Verrucomicrobiota bacterium]